MAFEFHPSRRNGQLADQRMHEGLASSLIYLASALDPVDPALSQPLLTLGQGIQSGGRVPSLVFAQYYQLVPAIQRQDWGHVRNLVRAMQAMGPRTETRQVLAYGDPQAAALVTALDRAEGEALPMDAVPAAEQRAFCALLDRGFALMEQHLPDLAQEIAAIVHEILLAQAPVGASVEFDGASHYQFWGLLMLNPRHHQSPLAVVEVLAHESAHSLLFGQTIEEPLVLNSDRELFASPLRQDPRPMDGIYHATFVSARMAWAMERMADVAALTPAERAQAADAAAKDRQNFAAGLATVQAHGRLSATGAEIMAAAEDGMKR